MHDHYHTFTSSVSTYAPNLHTCCTPYAIHDDQHFECFCPTSSQCVGPLPEITKWKPWTQEHLSSQKRIRSLLLYALLFVLLQPGLECP